MRVDTVNAILNEMIRLAATLGLWLKLKWQPLFISIFKCHSDKSIAVLDVMKPVCRPIFYLIVDLVFFVHLNLTDTVGTIELEI